MFSKADIAIIKTRLIKVMEKEKFLDAYNVVIEEFGVQPTADALAELHNFSQIDVIDGFLTIEKGVRDFWSLDSLIYYTIKKCTVLDIGKMIVLCSKVKEIEGNDLAAGRLFDAFEDYLSRSIEDSKQAFDLIANEGRLYDALPCITRAYAVFDKSAALQRLLLLSNRCDVDELTLASVFSLQYCVVEDVEARNRVRDCLRRFVGGGSSDLIKRAAYITSRTWGFSDLQRTLVSEGSHGVLRVVISEFGNKSRNIPDDEFNAKLKCFLSVGVADDGLLESLDYALQCQYEKHSEEVLKFVHEFIGSLVSKGKDLNVIKDVFSGLVRHLATKLTDIELTKTLSGLLLSEICIEQHFAFRIASNIEAGRHIVCDQLDVDVSKLTYLFRKALGWLYGRKEICIPLLFGCMTKMSIAQFKEIEELFYDPICLHYFKEVEAQAKEGVKDCDVEVHRAIENQIRRAKEFYAIFEKNGPCNELHPTAEMRTIAAERQYRLFAEAHSTAIKNSILGLFSENKLVLLHGGKMISHIKNDKGETIRQVSPMWSHSISYPIPKLLAINGTHVEDVLRGLRMEQLNK